MIKEKRVKGEKKIKKKVFNAISDEKQSKCFCWQELSYFML